MNLKKLFNNSDAVSPVIGVILMVAITVILAAAIGSSVFGQGPDKPAPQANIEITPVNISSSTAYVKLEHLGGDPIHFDDTTITKVTASLNGATSVSIYAVGLSTMSVGDVKILALHGVSTSGTSTSANAFASAPQAGNTVNIKIIDVKTNQLISDQDIRL